MVEPLIGTPPAGGEADGVQPRAPLGRRRLLRLAGLGAGTLAVTAAAGLTWAGVEGGVFATATGPAYAGRSRAGTDRGVAAAELPGDALIPSPDLVTTRSIIIRAEAPEVWPWIAQIGQGRGGLYSYDRLENLLGCDIHSAGRIHSEWQDIRVGDQVRLAPEMALTAVVVDLPRALVLRGGDVPMGALGSPFDFTWAFTLHAVPGGGTRLVVRERYAYRAWWAALLVRPTSLVSAVMSRRMLHGIRDRAEGRPVGPSVSADAPILERASAAPGRAAP